MKITVDAVEAALRTAWPQAQLTTDPVPLTGGQWASMARLAVRGTPPGAPGDLVLRIAPHAAMGAKELAVQRQMAEAGVATPAIRLSGPAGEPFDGAWAVMDFIPGTPLLAGLDGLAAARRLPQLARRLPAQLADTMAALHRIDPGPIIEHVRQSAPSTAFTVDELLLHLAAAAQASRQPNLIAAASALTASRPDQSGSVICHGDLHPLNLIEHDGRLVVLDWTAAVLAPPGYDITATWLLLRHPPLPAPAPLRPAIAAAARLLAGSFVRRYHAANPHAETGPLDWYAGLHALRILSELAFWQREHDPRAHSHPWRLLAPASTALLARATDISVRPV
ncbi:phosphotransferase family protein [Nonomuraea sp. NPDC049480]|uniref:phosphotransferase family protein n=1 Tax=Nonomuraea sp. NPDC049480 TaxID=3364353 RepID=UPI0037B4753F